MAKPTLLQDNWSRGQRQDEPRTRMPAASSWGLVDWIPNLGAPLRKRGGWSYGSDDIHVTHAGTTYVSAVVYADQFSSPQLVAIGDGGELVTINTSTNAVTDRGAGNAPVQVPVMHAALLIIPNNDGSTTVKKYTGAGAPAALAGSPPAAKFAAVYRDRTALGYTAAQKTRVYFSGAANPESWDTTNAWLSFRAPITGLAALPNALLVFQERATARVLGASPPPSVDMSVADPIFAVGCTDARSIAVNGSYCVFANPLGVYLSNGTNRPLDLTETVGLKRYWVELLAAYSASSWTLAGGFFRNLYVITVMNGSSFVDCIVFDVARETAYRLANFKGTSFAGAVTVGEELYWGLRSAARVCKFSTVFSPASGVKNDADGSAVLPVLETMVYGGRSMQKRWNNLYVDMDMRDAASDDPYLTVSYRKHVEDSYTAIATTLGETTTRSTKRLPLRVKSEGIAIKIAQTNPSSDTRLYALLADQHAREGSALS